MASINGVTVRKIETSWGHEGEEINRGVIYYNNKPLGEWAESGMGGCCEYNFDTDLLNKPYLTFLSELKKWGMDTRFYTIDTFIYDIVMLLDLQKWGKIKKALKQGDMAVVYVYFTTLESPKGYIFNIDELDKVLARNNTQIDENGYRIIIYNVGSFDIKLGSKEGYEQELNRVNEEKERRRKEREQYMQSEEMKKIRREKSRFKYVEGNPRGYIEDTKTGKKAEISRHSLNDTLDVLCDLFDGE